MRRSVMYGSPCVRSVRTRVWSGAFSIKRRNAPRLLVEVGEGCGQVAINAFRNDSDDAAGVDHRKESSEQVIQADHLVDECDFTRFVEPHVHDVALSRSNDDTLHPRFVFKWTGIRGHELHARAGK